MFIWLRRAFDLVCALAGLALLVLLGPCMLLTGASAHVPMAYELIRVDGTTTACRPVFGGVRLHLSGYETEFQSQLDSCIEAHVDLAQPARVALSVTAADLRAARPHVVISSFGLEVEDRVVHTVGADLQSARLDHAVVTATGLTCTLILLWLVSVTVAARRGPRLLLFGESWLSRSDTPGK